MTSSLLMNKNMISKTMKSTRNNIRKKPTKSPIKKSIRHQYTRLRLTTMSTKRLKTMQKKLLSSQLKKPPQQLRKKHQLKQNDCISRYSF